MIRQLHSDLPTFKRLEFHAGLNILLARPHPTTTLKPTSNATGKTSLIELLHFMLGARCDKDLMFYYEPLRSHTFYLTLDIPGRVLTVGRTGQKASEIILHHEEVVELPVDVIQAPKRNLQYISNESWKSYLGHAFYRFPLQSEADDDSDRPAFRSLLNYLIRRELIGGFKEPERSWSQQSVGEQQIALSYLFGIDESVAGAFQTIREREGFRKKFKKEMGTGYLRKLLGSAAELRTRKTVLGDKVTTLSAELSDFRVLPEYRELESEASDIVSKLGKMADENIADKQFLQLLQKSFEVETGPDIEVLEQLYHEVGLTFPDQVRHTFDEVRQFHESIIQNRLLQLSASREEVLARVAKRELNRETLASRHNLIMKTLDSYDALDQFKRFQSRLSKVEADFELVSKQHELVSTFEREKDAIAMAKLEAKNNLEVELNERKDHLAKAIIFFAEVSERLYGVPGELSFAPSLTGPRIQTFIEGQASKGITNMSTFCMDMAIARLWAASNKGFSVLVHDSHIFDGVDARQTARAIEYGREAAEKFGFQYIVTMNEDAMPWDLFQDKEEIRKTLLPITLDDGPGGGLFGIWFGDVDHRNDQDTSF